MCWTKPVSYVIFLHTVEDVKFAMRCSDVVRFKSSSSSCLWFLETLETTLRSWLHFIIIWFAMCIPEACLLFSLTDNSVFTASSLQNICQGLQVVNKEQRLQATSSRRSFSHWVHRMSNQDYGNSALFPTCILNWPLASNVNNFWSQNNLWPRAQKHSWHLGIAYISTALSCQAHRAQHTLLTCTELQKSYDARQHLFSVGIALPQARFKARLLMLNV